MKSFACRECGGEVRRPTAPLRCDACGAQRIGLFKEVQGGAAPPGARTPAAYPTPPVAAAAPPSPAATPSSAPHPAQTTPRLAPRPQPRSQPTQQPPQTASQQPDTPPALSPTVKAPVVAQPPAVSDPTPVETTQPVETTTAATPPAAASVPAPAPTPALAAALPAAPLAEPIADVVPKRTRPGSVLWRHPVHIPGQQISQVPLRNCVAVDQGGQCYACLGHQLVAMKTDSSGVQVAWEYGTGGHIPGSAAIGDDGRIRVHSSDGKLHCVTASGDAAWTPADVGEALGWTSPVVDEDNNTWICSYQGGLLRVDARGARQERPFFRTRQKFDSTPAIHRGVLYVGAEDGFVYAIALEGTRGKNLWDHLADKGKTEWFINSSPAVTVENRLIVAGRDEFLYAFDDDGSQAWKLHIRGQLLASPAIGTNGEIYVGVSIVVRGSEDRGKLIAIDSQSHRILWEYDARGAVEATPVVGDDGVVYFGDNSGMVHAVQSNGTHSWGQNAGHAIRSAGAITTNGQLIFGLDNGTLIGLASSSSQLADAQWPKYMGTAGQSGRR